jgi:sugar O-acyltransferase (sialic acid O-acetyltransferase NeuD family)
MAQDPSGAACELILVGAGAFGREVAVWARDAARVHGAWKLRGFLDNRPEALACYGLEEPVLGAPETWQPAPHERFVCTIGDPAGKLKLCRSLEQRGARFATIVHPTAIVGPHCMIGDGSILCPYAVVTTHATLGRHVTLNLHATVGHDAVLGDGCTLNCHADVTGRAVLGEGVFLGSHASVLPGTKVGDYARIAAGSVALDKVSAGATVIGVPARRLPAG